MTVDIEARLELLDQMNATLGKITNVQVRLTLAGETELAGKMDTKRQALLKQINALRGQVLDQWTTSAVDITEKLQGANRSVQRRIRSIRKNVQVADNAIKIIKQIDDALVFLKGLVVV